MRLLHTLTNTQAAENTQAPPGVLKPQLVVGVNQCSVAAAPAATEGCQLSVGEGAEKGDLCETDESGKWCGPAPRNTNVAAQVEDGTPPACTESSANGIEGVLEVRGGEEEDGEGVETDARREREREGEEGRGGGEKVEGTSLDITAAAATVVDCGINVIDVNGADAGVVVDDDDDDDDEGEGVADYHSDVGSVASHHSRQISGSSSR